MHGTVTLAMQSFSRYHTSYFDTESVMQAPFIPYTRGYDIILKGGDTGNDKNSRKDERVTHKTWKNMCIAH